MNDGAPTKTGLVCAEVPEPGRNPVLAYLANLGDGSVTSQRSALTQIARFDAGEEADVETYPWHRLHPPQVSVLTAALRAREPPYKPATLRRYFAALQGVLEWSWRLGHIDEETRARACDLPKVRGRSLGAGKALSPEDVRALFDACDPATHQGSRMAAALALLFGGGLRRKEAVTVQVENFDEVHRTATVLGKGAKERLVILGEWTPFLTGWLARRGRAPGPLLCRTDRWGNLYPSQGVSTAQLYNLVKDLGTRVGVQFSPHDGRRTAITSLLKAGIDLRRVQQFADHASATTTAGYDRTETEVVIAQVEKAGRAALGPPGTRDSERVPR